MTSALDRGGWSASRPGRLYPREGPATHCIGGWVGPRAGLDGCRKSRPSGIRSPDLATTEASVFLYSMYASVQYINIISMIPNNMKKKINIFLISVHLQAHSSSCRLTRKLRTTIYASDFCRCILSIFYYTKAVFSPPPVLTFLCPLG